MKQFLIGILKLFGIVFLRFRPLPRLWCVWLVGVNLGCLYFITNIEGLVVFLTTGVAIIIQTLIYQRIGFVRLLGVAHLLWLPMFAWILSRWDLIAAEPQLQNWLIILAITNAISFIIDSVDVFRFWRGERMPHYAWD